jgi:amino acid transporter
MWDVISHREAGRKLAGRGWSSEGGLMAAVVPETQPGGRGLRRNAVGLLGLIAQSVGVTAPEISAVVIAAVVATKVGAFTPLGFVVAAIGAIGLALVYGRFARYVPSAGGTYAIVRAGLGRDLGFLSGWILLAVGIIFVPGLLVAAAFLLQNFFQLTLPHHPFLYTSWWGWAFILGAIVMGISYFGIRISVRLLLALSAIGVTLLTILDVVILAKGGAHGWAWASISPWSTHGFGIGFFALGVGIAMTGFSGFETAVFLAEEAQTPKREVPKAVLGAVLLATAFFIVTTFAIVTGYGMNVAPKQWPNDSGGAVVGLSAQYMTLWYGKLLLLLLAISSFVSALGTANFTTRVAFSWGHDGYLPRTFGRTQRRYQSPHIAIAALAVVTAAVFVAGLIWKGHTLLGGLTYFSWLLQCGATGILPVYAAVGLAGAVHSARFGGTIVDKAIAPVLAIVVVVAGEVTEFYKQPSPFNWAWRIMLMWIALGVIVRLVTRARVAPVEREAEATQGELTPTPAV